MKSAKFPPSSGKRLIRKRKTRLELRSTVGVLNVETWYGQDAKSSRWLNVLRAHLGQGSREVMTPVFEERICFTATQTGSYEAASEVCGKWGSPIDDATIHEHVQQAGRRAEEQIEARVEEVRCPQTRSEVTRAAKERCPPHRFSLVIMMAGWMIRERGEQWGLKPAKKEADRVEWREMKSAIIFRIDHRTESSSGRRMLVEKSYASYRGPPEEFGARVYAEALRRGMAQAEKVYVVADGVCGSGIS
jgi:hypothetical protein